MNGFVTHFGFSDESHWNVGTFRSLGLVTVSIEHFYDIEAELGRLLNESKVRDFKWKNLDGAKERFAAEKMYRFAVEKACANKIRVDVLVWHTQDSRHDIRGRDDIENLQRMYYHLFRNVLRARWPNDAVWQLHPDEHTAMAWDTVKDCLDNVSKGFRVERSLFNEGKFRIRIYKEFGIQEILESRSCEHPLLQLADLFAGMAVFSREKYDVYSCWLQTKSDQMRLFHNVSERYKASRSLEERCQVLKSFNELCKERKLGVSLKSQRGLWTPKPAYPLNFWFYIPQHPDEKAPIRGKQ